MSKTPEIISSNDKLWSVLCHLSPFLGVGFILPLIIYLVTKDDVSSIPAHAKETLNFHISMFIYAVIGGVLILVLVGFVVVVAVAIATFILSIVGAIKASNGEVYRYPLTIRLIK